MFVQCELIHTTHTKRFKVTAQKWLPIVSPLIFHTWSTLSMEFKPSFNQPSDSNADRCLLEVSLKKKIPWIVHFLNDW